MEMNECMFVCFVCQYTCACACIYIIYYLTTQAPEGLYELRMQREFDDAETHHLTENDTVKTVHDLYSKSINLS